MQIAVWGVHMGWHVDNRPIDGGYVAIGWPNLGDLRAYLDRDAFKAALLAEAADGHTGAVPVQAGVLLRFVREMKAGDIVVYPSKHDRMVNIGRFTGETSYVEGDGDEYPNRRQVEWLGHYPRNDFSQAALNEIGSAVTLFRVRRHAAEFLAKVGLLSAGSAPAVVAEIADDSADDDAATESVSRQAEETTADFVIRRITGVFRRASLTP
jgi:restriction system protein